MTPSLLLSPVRGKHNNSSNSSGELTNSSNSKASSKATPDLTTSINQTVASMILSSLLALSCLISPVFLDNEMVRKRLVRRRKQGWQSEEDAGNDLSDAVPTKPMDAKRCK